MAFRLFSISHFPFTIFHLTADLFASGFSRTNDKWEMENGKWEMIGIGPV
jgi:hypothetical protein